MVEMSFVNNSYSVDKLLYDLHRGRKDELVEIMQGKLNGKAKLIDILKVVEGDKGGLNDAASKALSGIFLPAVEKLAEREGIKTNKLKRNLRLGLVELLKLRGSKLTLTDTLKQLVESPTDELVDKLQTFIVGLDNIKRPLSDANISKTDLINAIRNTQIGKAKPTEENFNTSPQVMYLSYSASFSLGRATPKPKLKDNEGVRATTGQVDEKGNAILLTSGKDTGYELIHNNTMRIVGQIQSKHDTFDMQYDDYYITLTYPPMYEKIFGKSEIIFQVDNEYSVNTINASKARDYLLAVARTQKSTSLFPKIKGLKQGSTALLRKGKNINPYLTNLLDSESVEMMDDLLRGISFQEYLTDDLIKDVIFGEMNQKERRDATLDKTKRYYYSDIFNAISGAINETQVGSLSEQDRKALSSAVNSSLEKRDSDSKLKSGIENKDYTIYENRGEADHDIIAIDKKSGMNIAFEKVIGDSSVKTILNRADIKNPYLSSRKVKGLQESNNRQENAWVLEEGGENPKNLKEFGKEPRQERSGTPQKTKTESGSIISLELDDALDEQSNRIIYNMALKGDISLDNNLNYYATKDDANVAFQAYFNLAWSIGDNIKSLSEKVDLVIDQEDAEIDDIVDAVDKLKDEISEALKTLKESLITSIQEKLEDIVKRKEHYANEVSEDLFTMLVDGNFIKLKDTDITEA